MFNQENPSHTETGVYLQRSEIEQAITNAQQYLETVKHFAEEVKAKRDSWMSEGFTKYTEELTVTLAQIDKSVEDSAQNCERFKELLAKYDDMEREHAEDMDRIKAEEVALKERIAELKAQKADYERQTEEIKRNS